MIKKRRRRVFYLLLSLVISGILIYLLFSQISIQNFIFTLKNLYWPSLLAYMIISLTGALIRAWRYRLLLKPDQVSWSGIILVTLVKNSLVDLLPARLGSLSYIYLLNRRLGLAFESVTSSFIAAFLLDFLTLSPFLIVAILSVGLGIDPIASPVVLAMAIFFFIMVILAFLFLIPLSKFCFQIYFFLGGKLRLIHKKWFQKSIDKFRGTIDLLRLTRRHSSSWLIFFLSFSIRLAKYGSLFFLLHSLLQSFGFGLAQLSFWRLILGTSGAELTSALPIKGIAGFGTWESAWALTFRLMGTEKNIAIISGLGVHFLTNLFEYSLGITSLFLLALPYLHRNQVQRS
ncbi:MAG: flippase-like domain-containing protein [Candidatus Aminicenantes bacterium]|nr:flippase-like domain-containing protein [Candidatus Aminicenantes bacterium]